MKGGRKDVIPRRRPADGAPADALPDGDDALDRRPRRHADRGSGGGRPHLPPDRSVSTPGRVPSLGAAPVTFVAPITPKSGGGNGSAYNHGLNWLASGPRYLVVLIQGGTARKHRTGGR